MQVVQRDDWLRARIQELKAEHPFWGYRRIWAYLRFVEQRAVNKKCILRLMREHPLLVPPHLRLRANRTPRVSKPKATKPNEWWGIDTTEVLVEWVGWVSVGVVLDWYMQVSIGYDAGLRGTSEHWLAAADMAINRQFLHGIPEYGLCLMSDNGCQPTSQDFREAWSTLGIHQTFTSDSNPRGNANTERFMRMLKAECLWLQKWTCLFRMISTLEC